MRIAKSFINMVKGDKERLKVLAFAIRLKLSLTHSRLPYFSIDRLAKAAGVTYKTAKKYFPKLIEGGYIHIGGKNKASCLVVNSLSSRHKNRNFDITILNLSTFQEAVRSLSAFLILRLQSRKDYMKHLLQLNHNPRKCDNFRAVRKKVRNLVRAGHLHSVQQKYVERGLSLKRIAKEIGCSVSTAIKVINHSISNGWLMKQHHVEQIYSKGVNYFPVEWATFTTKNNIYVVKPNTYNLTPLSLSCFPWLTSTTSGQ